MKRVFKYPIQIEDEAELEAPACAEWLTVQEQNGVVCLWALVDDLVVKKTYKVSVRGTGHQADGLSAETYVGSVQLHGGALVFHVFVD